MKKKKTFEWRKRDVVHAEVTVNTESKLEIYFYWNIYAKKNGKRAFRWIVLPSENYCEWHKRIEKSLKWIEWNFKQFPCKATIETIAHSKVKWDIDNQATSIFDMLTDLWAIEDDNKFVIAELDVKCVWYIKNCPITKLTLEPISFEQYNISNDHSAGNLENRKQYFN